jgi:hypothetical protein
MQSIFSNALSRAVSKHIDLSATRRETLSWLALLIMQHGTISLWRLAAYVASAAQIASVRRRFYRFFQFVDIDGTLAARVVVDLLRLSGKPWVLAIDRGAQPPRYQEEHDNAVGNADAAGAVGHDVEEAARHHLSASTGLIDPLSIPCPSRE